MFFNDGSGNPNNNLAASFLLGHISTDPANQLDAMAQMSLGYSPLVTIGLGTVAMGTPITATVQWDQPNHQFVITWTNNTTHQTTTGNIPYTYSDTTPPVSPNDTLCHLLIDDPPFVRTKGGFLKATISVPGSTCS